MIILPFFIYRDRPVYRGAALGSGDIERMRKELRDLAPIVTKLFDDAKALYDGAETAG